MIVIFVFPYKESVLIQVVGETGRGDLLVYTLCFF